jgi:tellurite resistance protein
MLRAVKCIVHSDKHATVPELCQIVVRNVKPTFKPLSRQYENHFRMTKAKLFSLLHGVKFTQSKSRRIVDTGVKISADGHPGLIALIGC